MSATDDITPAGQSKLSRRSKTAGRDPYWNVVFQQWPHIVMLYEQYADKKPMMLYDIQELRVYAYPFAEFRAELSEQSQASLTRQYKRALAEEMPSSSAGTMSNRSSCRTVYGWRTRPDLRVRPRGGEIGVSGEAVEGGGSRHDYAPGRLQPHGRPRATPS